MTTATQNNDHNLEVERPCCALGLAILDIIIGVVTFCLNIAMWITLTNYFDMVSVGIWGGCLFIFAGVNTITKVQNLVTLGWSFFAAVALICFYGFNIYWQENNNFCFGYSIYINETAIIQSPLADESQCSWRLAADITFVVSGCLAAIINGFLVFHAIRTENQQIIYHGVPATTHLKQQMDGVNSTSPPASPTNGTNSYQTNQQLTQNVSKKKRPRP